MYSSREHFKFKFAFFYVAIKRPMKSLHYWCVKIIAFSWYLPKKKGSAVLSLHSFNPTKSSLNKIACKPKQSWLETYKSEASNMEEEKITSVKKKILKPRSKCISSFKSQLQETEKQSTSIGKQGNLNRTLHVKS